MQNLRQHTQTKERNDKIGRQAIIMKLILSINHSLGYLGVMILQFWMILELWIQEFCDTTTKKLSFHIPSFPTITLTRLSSRVLFPISLSTWCSSKLNCSLEIIPGHFGGGGGGCDWPARALASRCNTGRLLTAQCIKAKHVHNLTHFTPCRVTRSDSRPQP